MNPKESDLLAYINATPALLSLLYDIDLMPEQCEQPRRRHEMLTLAAHWQAQFNESATQVHDTAVSQPANPESVRPEPASADLLRLCDEIDALLAKDPGILTARECSCIYTTLRSAAGTLSAAARQSVRCGELLSRALLQDRGDWPRDLVRDIEKEIET